MPTSAERLYDAAAAALTEQQTTAARMTGIMVPIGAAATAGALLLGPALHDIAHARFVQIAGLVVGGIGISVVVILGFIVLVGPTIEGVEPKLLLEQANRADVMDGTHDFQTEAAVALVGVRRENKNRLDRFRIVLTVVYVCLAIELIGFGAATLVQPRSKSSPTISAGLSVTTAHLNGPALGIVGRLMPQAHGRVLISVDLLGRTGEQATTSVAIEGGRFHARVRAPRDLAPLMSATYTVDWPGSRAVRSAEVGGSLARDAEGCRSGLLAKAPYGAVECEYGRSNTGRESCRVRWHYHRASCRRGTDSR